MKRQRNQIQMWILPILLMALAGLYAYLLNPDVAGFLYDDGMYLMTAKALATGQGYRLIDIVGQPLFYKYPPLYPLMLAGMWLMQPHFPANIVWLKSLNIALLLGSFALLDHYFRKAHNLPRWVSLGLIAWLGTNWHLIEVTIDMMSEPLFLLLSTLALLLLQTASEKNTKARLALLITVSVAACYTRSMGLALVVAATIWLAMKANRRYAGRYLAGCMALIAPWVVWSASKPDTTQAVGNFLVRSFQETYAQSFRMDLTYEYTLAGMLLKGVQELLGTAAMQFFPILERLQALAPPGLFTTLLLALSFALVLLLGMQTYRAYQARQFSISAAYCLVYLAVLPWWSFYNFYPRFLVVLLPFLLIILVQAIQRHVPSAKQQSQGIIALLTVGIVSNCVDLYAYLAKPSPNTLVINTRTDVWADYASTIQFLNQRTSANAIIYTDNTDDAYLYALHTHRKTLDQFLFLPSATIDAACPQITRACLMDFYAQNADATWQILQKNNVGYLIINRMQVTKTPANSRRLIPKTTPTSNLILTKHTRQMIPVMQTPDGWISVYQLLKTPLKFDSGAIHQPAESFGKDQ